MKFIYPIGFIDIEVVDIIKIGSVDEITGIEEILKSQDRGECLLPVFNGFELFPPKDITNNYRFRILDLSNMIGFYEGVSTIIMGASLTIQELDTFIDGLSSLFIPPILPFESIGSLYWSGVLRGFYGINIDNLVDIPVYVTVEGDPAYKKPYRIIPVMIRAGKRYLNNVVVACIETPFSDALALWAKMRKGNIYPRFFNLYLLSNGIYLCIIGLKSRELRYFKKIYGDDYKVYINLMDLDLDRLYNSNYIGKEHLDRYHYVLNKIYDTGRLKALGNMDNVELLYLDLLAGILFYRCFMVDAPNEYIRCITIESGRIIGLDYRDI